MRAAFHTFGCRLNQLETEALADSFREACFEIVPLSEQAQIYVINTCTVTSKSEQKARGLIRRISRENPGSVIIVTGCYTQMEEESVKALAPRVFAVPLKDKDLIQDYALHLSQADGDMAEETERWFRENRREKDSGEGRFRFVPSDFIYHTRAYLKIQDGCDNRCAYCRVTLARGPSVSLDKDQVLKRLAYLEERGFGEVTLTGVNIDSYAGGGTDLAGLLDAALARTGRIRIRLSSLDPDTFTPRLARSVAHPRICPYFHISLQSGSDAVLEGMNRRYGRKDVLRAVSLLRETREDPFLSCDVIVGFPGETEQDFLDTLALMDEARFSRAHVFPYSPRPGTEAFGRTDQVARDVITHRASRLREIMADSQGDYGRRWEGRELEVLWEKEEKGVSLGLSGNYLTCLLREGSTGRGRQGTLERVRAVSYDSESGHMTCVSPTAE